MRTCSKNEDMAMRCVVLSCVDTASAMVRAHLQRRILPNVLKNIFSIHKFEREGAQFREERENAPGKEQSARF
jgi:hypothetical protein